jgi:hypothetical protein
VSEDRLQADFKFPPGIRKALEKLAAAHGLGVVLYCRTILIEHALTNGDKK